MNKLRNIIVNVLARNSSALLIDYSDVISITNLIVKKVNLRGYLENWMDDLEWIDRQIYFERFLKSVLLILKKQLPIKVQDSNSDIALKIAKMIVYRVNRSIAIRDNRKYFPALVNYALSEE